MEMCYFPGEGAVEVGIKYRVDFYTTAEVSGRSSEVQNCQCNTDQGYTCPHSPAIYLQGLQNILAKPCSQITLIYIYYFQ